MFAVGRARDARFVIIVLHARDTIARSHDIALKSVGHVAPPERAGQVFHLERPAGIMEFNYRKFCNATSIRPDV